MVRSYWMGALVLGASWTSLARSQAPAPARALPAAAPAASVGVGPAMPGERIVTIQEAGKPGQRCRVLKTWQQPDGSTAHQVQALDSGEIMTIVESGPLTAPAGATSRVRAVTTRIFHWGRGNREPQGAPVPPANAVVLGAPVVAEPQPTRVAPTPASSYVVRPGGTQAVPPSQMPVVSSGAPLPQIVNGNPMAPCPSCLCQTCPSCECPKCPSCPGPVIVNGPLESRPSLLDRIRGREVASCESGACEQPSLLDRLRSREIVTTVPTVPEQPSPVVVENRPKRESLLSRLRHHSTDESPVPVKENTPPAPPPVVHKPQPAPAPTETAQARDYRESWGKIDPWKMKSSQAYRDDLYRTAPGSTGSREKAAVTVKAGEQPQVPDWYYRKPVSDFQAKDSFKGKDDFRTGTAGLPSNYRNFPPGSCQIGPAGPMPVPPDPFRNLVRQPVYPGAPIAPYDSGVPSGMANAFTDAGTRRPIPADFGSAHVADNAFSTPAADAMASASMSQFGQAPPGMAETPGAPFNAFVAPGAPTPARPPVAGAGYYPPNHGYLPGTGPGYAPQGMPSNPGMGVPTSRPYMPPAAAQVPVNQRLEHASAPELMVVLKDSLYPSEREWAAEFLSRNDWHRAPEVVQALVSGAKDDPAPAVRAGCVRALARMKVNTYPVVTTVRALKADADPRVRQEVDEALTAMGVPAETRPENTVRTAGASEGK